MNSISHPTSKPLATVVGLCLGASTISLVELARKDKDGCAVDGPQLVHKARFPHEGDPRGTLTAALKTLDTRRVTAIAATGRSFRKFVNLTSIPEPLAVEYAYRRLKPGNVDCPAVVSAGGETFMAYLLDPAGRITNVITGNKCASGTGEFFLQQLRRMNVSLEEAAKWAAETEPYPVSGRCSVFCKSDCTHATNKGIPKSKVTSGLCRMMADKILELLKKVELRNIMVTGGTALNRTMVTYLKDAIPGLSVPPEAPYFEALGAALWALDHETAPLPPGDALFKADATSFERLSALAQYENQVEFKTLTRGKIAAGDTCILGLDVGSTTTKAILLRPADTALLGGIYLRTNGDPVGASRECYRALAEQIREQIGAQAITITGLGVTGSGRQIAGLHAQTAGIINEIIAHATAAVHFDPQVDTIFEIGGQDAKYTYITNGVPADYAMNEACSAGTGSFLEESALETLGVPVEQIAETALKGQNPPNFNDQCAAFIASDIKTAIHESIAHNDIVAGLVYSICMNYTNRVKGNRPVGAKIFMQGGVCYNRAVPLAMAALVGKPIVVPPEPGLMGAFGVALEVHQRMAAGFLAPQSFDLDELANREVHYGKSFICKGGKERCDRKCEIARVEVAGEKHAFGGACNRYYNLRHNLRYDVAKLDFIRDRQNLIYQSRDTGPATRRGTIGFNRSFLVNTYYPLYAGFFTRLGFTPVMPATPDPRGIDQRGAAFCYPAELAHGYFYSLLKAQPRPDFIFLPHFKAIPSLEQDGRNSQVCPLVQGETFYLQATFRRKLAELKQSGTRVLAPLLDLQKGLDQAQSALVETAIQMGVPRLEARQAFQYGLERQEACFAEMQERGRKMLAQLSQNPDQIGVVIFARPYNGYVEEAHMGIPHKLASRGVTVIPLDYLPLAGRRSKRHMYWGMGQLILKASRLVAEHPQLFGTYITNFSCGPDSFILGFFRTIMGRKPSLTLELDSHTADAGLETRIEAFLDIVSAYRRQPAKPAASPGAQPARFQPARTRIENGRLTVTTSSGETLPLQHPRVKLLFPSMGRLGSEAMAAVARASGFNSLAHPPADEMVLKIGRAHSSCKECLPLILTTGTLLNYINNGRRPDEILVYFMPTGSGPCRFGQYYIYMEDLIRRMAIPDVAMLSLTSENSYTGLGKGFERYGWWGVLTSDGMEDIRAMLLANARDTAAAMEAFESEWQAILAALESGEWPLLQNQLKGSMANLKEIPLKQPAGRVPTIALTGEIFVRRDGLSRRYITEHLAQEGFATICAPIAEWVRYTQYLVDAGLVDRKVTMGERLRHILRKKYMSLYERRIKTILTSSGLVQAQPLKVEEFIKQAAPYVSSDLCGEAVLTVGSSLKEIVHEACGVIAIGPFGCMPNRLSEAILSETMTSADKLSAEPADLHLKEVLAEIRDLPFLAIESDGSPFPQMINAKLETFLIRARRLHRAMAKQGSGDW